VLVRGQNKVKAVIEPTIFCVNVAPFRGVWTPIVVAETTESDASEATLAGVKSLTSAAATHHAKETVRLR
jgi:hypothetical protein